MKPEASQDLQRIKRYTQILDTQFTIPGTSIRFGFDFLLGLIPFGGHLLTFVFSSFLVANMAKHKVSSYVVARMVVNIVIDTVVGSIPILGNLFDLWFKSNERNFKLLERHYGEGKYQGSFWKVLIPVLIIFLLLISAIIWVIFKIIGEFLELF